MSTITADEGVLAQYQAQTVTSLRTPLVRRILYSILLGAWIIAVPHAQPENRPTLALCLLAMVLAMACLLLLRDHYYVSVGLLLPGLTALGLYATLAYPHLPVAYLLCLVTALGILTCDARVGAALAAVNSAGLLFVANGLHAIPLPGMALLLNWLAFWTVWQGTEPMTTLVGWSWHSYADARQRAAELQERQGKLAQVLKDLDGAYNELAKANHRLAQSKAVAEEARRAKAEFVANVSHELRTPINMIIGFTEMIVRSPRTYAHNGLPASLLADLDVVLRNARHLSDLINDILDLSQLDVGRMGLVKEWTSLDEIAHAAVAAIEPLARMRGLPIRLEVEPGLPPILADRTRVRQVLLNLLSNAVRFTEAGHIGVGVQRQGEHIVTAVTDTGPGIADGDIPKMFEPFRQLDGSLRRRYGGTGLGLHISRNFVALHGGEMTVESCLGKGTTISFSLPIEDRVPFAQLERTPEHDDETVTNAAYVVSEPRPVIEGLMRRYLDGVNVLPAAGLPEAVALSREQPTLGIVVRAAHAQEAGVLLQQAVHTPLEAPLIACSLPGAIEAYSEELGLAGYLLKPVAREQLREALRPYPKAATALIVDDNTDFMRLFARMLRSVTRSCTVWQAMSGAEALALLENRRPDIIFLDVLLPDIAGPALVERIRAQEALKDIPIFFVTARDAAGSPLVADFLGLTHHGGLSADELVRCIQGIGEALKGAIPPADRELPTAPPA